MILFIPPPQKTCYNQGVNNVQARGIIVDNGGVGGMGEGMLCDDIDMADYPTYTYSKGALRRASKSLARPIYIAGENDGLDQDSLDIFRVANQWRAAHAYPMDSIRRSVAGLMRWHNVSGVTASRLKSMVSIRKKLSRSTVSLDKMNDLAGCRAILDDMAQVNHLIGLCKEKLRHDVHGKEYNYIATPKQDGYRSYHIVFLYIGKGDTPYDGQRIELQIRTRLQHSWATCVEAVGLFRNEDIKGGEGDPRWRDLFTLMSEEFAYAEGYGGDDARRIARVDAIKALNEELDALNFLENIRKATHITNRFRVKKHGEKPNYYVLQYDHERKTVDITASSAISAGASYFDGVEDDIRVHHKNSSAVFVRVDKIERLCEAYPAYFGDVSLFIENLKRICGGSQTLEYTMIAPDITQKITQEREKPIDPKWLWPGRHRRWV